MSASQVDIVVFDERYAEAERFASELAKEGTVALATRGEVVTLWRESAFAASGYRGLRIAGLTQHSDFELLRFFGAKAGLSVLHEARHTRSASGMLSHVIRCEANEWVTGACVDSVWPERLARALTGRAQGNSGADGETIAPVAVAIPPRAGTLTSCLLG